MCSTLRVIDLISLRTTAVQQLTLCLDTQPVPAAPNGGQFGTSFCTSDSSHLIGSVP